MKMGFPPMFEGGYLYYNGEHQGDYNNFGVIKGYV